MKITHIKATPVNIPQVAPFLWSVGTYPGTSRTIIEVMTDEGLVGLGEAPSTHCAPIVRDVLAPILIGHDALDITGCELVCVPETKIDPNTDDLSVLRAFGGIEMALWDLRGKAWQLPLYKLLGGAVRKAIPFTEYFAYRQPADGKGGEMDPTAVARYCAHMRESHGSTFFEGKCPPGDVQATVEVVHEIRAAVGDDAMIRLDANMGFALDSARYLLQQLEPYHIDNFEDPVATFYEMAQLRQHSIIPFSTHIPDLKLAVKLGTPENFVLNLTCLGGISKTLKFIAACEEMGHGFWFYSGDAGIATAAYLHVSAAVAHIRRPSQSLLRWQTDDVIQGGPFQPQNNVVPVPEGPGLGVTLSPKGLKRCHERFVADGPYDHYQDPANPGRYTRIPVG